MIGLFVGQESVFLERPKKERLGWFCSLLSLPVFPPDSGQSLPRQPSRCPFNDRSFENESSNVYARL
jgi:hypothetical protein